MTEPQKENDDDLLRLIESATAPAGTPASPRSSATTGSDEQQLRAAWLALGNLIEQAGMAADRPPASLEQLASRKPEDLPRPRSLEPVAPPPRSARKVSKTDVARWRRLSWLFSAAVVLLIVLWAFPRLYQLNLNRSQTGSAELAAGQPEKERSEPGSGGGPSAGGSSTLPKASDPLKPAAREPDAQKTVAPEPSRAVASATDAPGDSADRAKPADQLAWDDQLDEMIWAAAEATAQIDSGALAQTSVLADRLDQLRSDLDGGDF